MNRDALIVAFKNKVDQWAANQNHYYGYFGCEELG